MPYWTTLLLDDPERGNRLTRARLAKLREELEVLEEQKDLRVLIITGAGGYFSVGADLREIGALDEETAGQFSHEGQDVLTKLSRVAPVTIAAIDGFCLGGGLDLAMSCTLRYASRRSTFQHPGARRGIITGWGGTQRLPRLIGQDAALRLLILGEEIDANAALRIGLITGIADDPLQYSVDLATRIAAGHTRDQLTVLLRELD